jgi:hypothetical protein
MVKKLFARYCPFKTVQLQAMKKADLLDCFLKLSLILLFL